jgi:sugar phosphate isomerase/epimerase
VAKSVIAAQMYTLRQALKTPADIARTMHEVKAIGYDVVQLSGLGPIDPKELAKILEGEGLVCCATHTGLDRMQKEFEQVVEEHQLWKCAHIAVPSLPSEFRGTEEAFVKGAKAMSAVGLKLAERGITLSYHNHSFEFQRFGKRTGLDIIYDESDPAGLKGEIDTYWVQHGGGSPATWCKRLAGRLPLVHLKDMEMVPVEGKLQQTYAEVGEGNLDWPAILKACKAAKCQWYIVEQDTCRRPPLESLKVSLENLRSMGLK